MFFYYCVGYNGFYLWVLGRIKVSVFIGGWLVVGRCLMNINRWIMMEEKEMMEYFNKDFVLNI